MKHPIPTPRSTELPLEQRAAVSDRRERTIFVILRNLIPIIGLLFLGWSAQNLILLYFMDTLGAMWALFTALALYFTATTSGPNIFARIYALFVGLFAGAFLVVFMAIPLGMPLFIYSQMTSFSWESVMGDTDFIYGLILIGALSLVGMLRHYQNIRQVTLDKSNIRDEFGILMVRWVIVLIVTYMLGFLLGEYGAYVMVLGYIGATVYSELYPERFANLLGPAGKSKV